MVLTLLCCSGNSANSGANTLSAVQVKTKLQTQLDTPGSKLLSGLWTGSATAASAITANNGVFAKCADGEILHSFFDSALNA